MKIFVKTPDMDILEEMDFINIIKRERGARIMQRREG